MISRCPFPAQFALRLTTKRPYASGYSYPSTIRLGRSNNQPLLQRQRNIRNYSFLAESNRWKEQVVMDHEDSKGISSTIAVPLSTTDWDSLMRNLRNADLKLWLEEQRGVIRLWPEVTNEINDILCLRLSSEHISSAPKIVLIRFDKELESTSASSRSCELQPPDKRMEPLCKVTSNDPFRIVLPPRSDFNASELLQSFLLSSYTFDRYKSNTTRSPLNKIIAEPETEMNALVSSTFWCQDLISTPARDLSPANLQQAAQEWVDSQTPKSVAMECIIGDALLSYNGSLATTFGCGMIHAVGQGARTEDRLPRLIRMKYEPSKKPPSTKTVALVGKGVTFDTGGLNLKPGESMLTMKKDMGGAAHALGLFRLLVETKYPLPVELFLPIVENVIGSHSYRPGDILTSVNGKTTEIGNTDAEGRLILGDALALASAEKPSIIIDFATLTGAARSALGTELPALFTNQSGLEIEAMIQASQVSRDPIWSLPLWEGYRSRMKGKIADFGNIANDNGLGGAITAALYLSEFVDNVPWYHLDLHGLDKEGRGRAQGLHAMYAFLNTYGCQSS